MKNFKKLLYLSLVIVYFNGIVINASEITIPLVEENQESNELIYAPLHPTNDEIKTVNEEDLIIIPDENLELCLSDKLHVNVGEITVGDIADIQVLNLGECNISDLTGIEYASSVIDLYLDNNNISDLTPLRNLPKIRELNLRHNNISDLSPLSNLTSLYSLYLEDNNIIDMSPLSNLSSLHYLYLSNNNISIIGDATNLSSLSRLYLGNNNITDISSLSNLTSLFTLELTDNNITDISSLSNLTSLDTLELNENNINDVTPLESIKKLRVLDLSNNNISDLSPLENSLYLKNLYAANNNISDISVVNSIPNLQVLNLGGNEIENIDSIANLDSLIILNLANNQIKDIDAIGGTNFNDLYLNNNQISDISALENNPKLRELYIDNNNISDLSPLSTIPRLSYVSAEDQVLNLDDIVVYNDDEIINKSVHSLVDELEISLGIPQEGSNILRGTWYVNEVYRPEGTSIVAPYYFSGTINQKVIFKVPLLTGDANANVNEEIVLSDDELLNLFNATTNTDSDISVDQSEVDYFTPGEYNVIFSDEFGNNNTGILTIVDVLPTIESLDTLTIVLGERVEDYISDFGVEATEITSGDLTNEIIVDYSNVNYKSTGNYDVVFTVSDNEGNAVVETSTLAIVRDLTEADTITPVIPVEETDGDEVEETNRDEVEETSGDEVEDNKLNVASNEYSKMSLTETGKIDSIFFLIISLVLLISIKKSMLE